MDLCYVLYWSATHFFPSELLAWPETDVKMALLTRLQITHKAYPAVSVTLLPVFRSCLELWGQLVSLCLGEGGTGGEGNHKYVCFAWKIFLKCDTKVFWMPESSVVTLQIQLLCRLDILYWSKVLFQYKLYHYCLKGTKIWAFYSTLVTAIPYWKNYS